MEDVFPLSYDNFVDFLENAFPNPNPISIANNYTDKIPELVNMIKFLYPHFTSPQLKNRCTRLINKLSLTPDKDKN